MNEERFRVQKLLSNYGYCSRREGERLIDEGRVKVNGDIVTIGDSATLLDTISVDNKPINQESKVYLLFNKPEGFVCSLDDRHNRTIMEFIKIKERVFPVGRLDSDTTGLLLLTNDGDFANKVTHPRYEIKKTYRVAIDHQILARDIKEIERGVEIDGYITSPAKVKRINDILVDIVIHEGKKHIVKNIFKALGYQVIRLKRTKIGNLQLGGLKPGQYKKLNQDELKKIFEK